MLKKFVLAMVASLGLSQAVQADHYMQSADPQVVQAINEIVYALGQGCNAGNAQACQAIPMAQQQAHLMLNAGYDCQYYGNQQACGFYQQNIYQLQQTYYQVQQAAQSGMLYQNTGNTAGMGSGLSHAQRMQQIHDMGVQNTMRYQQRQQMMDQSHQQFLDMIRQ